MLRSLWTLAGVVAIEAMGGPVIPWKAGRTDYTDESSCAPNGRLPDASQAADHLRDVFYRMGFSQLSSFPGSDSRSDDHGIHQMTRRLLP